MSNNRKLKIGWFSFTCCEDSTIIFTELLNEHYDEWRNGIEFKHVRILKTENSLKDLDIAFVEGAISSIKQRQELLEIRKNCKKLVAIGSCAVIGQPSGARNTFTQEQKTKYKEVFDTFQYSEKVQRLDEIVTVDDKISGCPMKGEEFVEKLDGYLQEFGIKNVQVYVKKYFVGKVRGTRFCARALKLDLCEDDIGSMMPCLD